MFSIFLGKRRKYNLILAGLLLCLWFIRSFSISFPEDVIENDVEVVFWNCARANSFKTAFLENEGIPDIMVLNEAKAISLDRVKKKYPEYYFYKSDFQIDIFSKTPIDIEIEQVSKFNSAVIKFSSAGINFYVVDMTASLDVPKTWEFKFENKIVKNTENTIVLGDFNVPYESRFLNDLKDHYNHFFSKKGNGFRETWPWNMPLLSIDHIWVSKDLKIINSEKINTRNSDHSMIKTVIRK
ncbi:endonuclease/exonuclease/phosphatase family protein [Algibacter sp. L4_22]|uniref:endonuclease/exonuclease/phosphatase family protein n=1 Tax=Algibacter sp. L4_22 TaxID=2942477 RepID=UPI00201B7038|nr:endonuclease/exonuclease/phosphatase family protein [Algibacter sp. L4_22]MCL5127368.1 endonuclease/exonuclease/phosphatase family protein [Algibacter sp. L4_22]